MSTAFALAVLLGLIGTVIGIVALPFKAARRWSRRTVTMSALSLLLFFGLFIWASNREAEIAGFESLVDRQRAKDAGYTEADKRKARGDSDHDELQQVAAAPKAKEHTEQAEQSRECEENGGCKTYTGQVLPFTVIRAIRNESFKDGIIAAQVSVSIEGGTQADWAATAAYVAEQTIINNVTFSTVEVYVPNPWGDFPPTATKTLAKAYYSGPDPKRSPWPDEQWAVFVSNRAGTLADIEFEELSGALLEKFGSKIDDPNELSNKADAEARRLIIRKYHLSNNWQPSILIGPGGDRIARYQIHVTITEGLDKSISALHECLSRTSPGPLFRGCMPVKIDYEFVLANATGKWSPDDPGKYVTKVDFTVAWAKKLKEFHTLEELQRAAGTKGTISERSLEGEHPSVRYHWRSEPKNGRVGYMVATVYRDGGIGVGIMTDEDIEIIVNNFGAFICERCSPPIDIRGAEPSWTK